MSLQSPEPTFISAPPMHTEKRQIARDTLRLFLPFFAVILTTTTIILWVSENAEMREERERNRVTVEALAEDLNSAIQSVSSDLIFLANQKYTVDVWREDGKPFPEILTDLENEYLGISKFRGIYDQVRLLDGEGQEIARINFNNGVPVIVPEEELQNKRDRYYFIDIFKLKRDEVFVSPLDLNIENSLIEQPQKPMVRFGTPVFDRNGTKRGVMILNYFGDKLLEHFSHPSVSEIDKSQLMLLNADGYWLKAPDPDDEWGFMFDNRKDRTFANAYPTAWDIINTDDFSQFITAEGMFTSQTVYPLREGQKSSTGSSEAAAPSKSGLDAEEYYWKVVAFIPNQVLYANRNTRRLNAGLLVSVLSVLFFVGSRRVSKDNVLRQRAEAELLEKEKYYYLFENTMAGVGIATPEGKVLAMNKAMNRILGYNLNEASGLDIKDIYVNLDDRRRFVEQMQRKGIVENFEIQVQKKTGEIRWVTFSSRLIRYEGQPAYLTTALDITARMQANEAVQQYISRLDALHQIDRAIISNFDLRVIFHVVLDQMLTHLQIDAAVILRTQEQSRTLVFSESQGFRTDAYQHSQIQVGSGKIGRAIQQKQNLFIPDLNQPGEGTATLFTGLREEGFVSYYQLPLVSKSTLVGVLQVFNRSRLEPDDTWVEQLQMFADQAAIAIDNITLFDNLQDTNIRLVQAYDATIEGWAKALELRDMETEEHSRRVVELTMALAKTIGVHDEELVHIRRGALLHDIGKMGIPDKILQNPGTLSEEEWEILRHHPVLAHEWLSDIEYLHPALDIPYCHHEKWDGTGYPRGLKGEQIPLAARIFAVIDVWDALLSDRPYRKAWSREKVLNYILDLSGKQFDPRVVEAFIKYVDNLKKLKPDL